MNSKLIALASAAIALTAVAIPNQAEARWRGGGAGWWVPGAVIGGLALGAAIASRPYYYGPGPYNAYGYGGGPYYGGGSYYGGGPRYYYARPYRNWTEF